MSVVMNRIWSVLPFWGNIQIALKPIDFIVAEARKTREFIFLPKKWNSPDLLMLFEVQPYSIDKLG